MARAENFTFYIGQKIVCVAQTREYLINNKTYRVRNLFLCCQLTIDVGLSAKKGKGSQCHLCNSSPGIDGVKWLKSKYFVPLDEWNEADEAVEKYMIAIKQHKKTDK